jgi:hypothetical protein
MNAAVQSAVRELRGRGALTPAQTAFFGRVARGELVSVRWELQVALWAGVTMIATGTGVLVRERLASLGPLAVGAGIALGAALCFWYVARHAPAFSRAEVPSPTLAFDYVLLLGTLLAAADLAYLETRLKLLGPAWPWHLLIVALAQLALAYRYDARGVLSLGLASFAAWRGVALSSAGRTLLDGGSETLRLNALAVGAVYLLAGLAARRRGLKPHFEPVWTVLGLLLLLGAPVSGIFNQWRQPVGPWAALLALLAPATIAIAYRRRRADWFAIGVMAAYVGLMRAVAEISVFRDAGWLAFASLTTLAVLGLIVWAHRAWKEPE